MVELLEKGKRADNARDLPETQPWNFGTPERPLELDEFLSRFPNEKGTEKWLRGIKQLGWDNFFLVCTKDMSDLSYRARRLVIEYCLEIIANFAAKIKGKVTRQAVQDLMKSEFVEEYDNPVFQFHWAIREKVIKEAVMTAFRNRFPS